MQAFAEQLNEAVKTGAIKSADKFLTLITDLAKHPLETIKQQIKQSNAIYNQELLKALQNKLTALTEKTLTSTSDQLVTGICNHTQKQGFFDKVEQTTEQIVDAIFLIGTCVGTSSAFEVGSAAIKNMAEKSIPMQEAIELGLKEVGASTPVELNELLSKASELEQKINTNLPTIEKTVTQETPQITNQINSNIKVEQSIEKQSNEEKATYHNPTKPDEIVSSLPQNEIISVKEIEEIRQHNLQYKFPATHEQLLCEYLDRNIPHIFADRPGHLPNTPENTALLLKIASDPNNYFAKPDIHGSLWCEKILPNNTQIWIQGRNGQIRNGGINLIPQKWNPETGLSQFIKSQK